MQAASQRLYSAAARGPTCYRFAQRAAHAGRQAVARASSAAETRPSWDIRMLYDGECPLCMREVNFLRSRDAGKGKIDFVDVAAATYDPAQNAGITFQAAMERIHAILADGRVITDVEVFRQLYEAVGLGWVYAITRVEPIGGLVDKLYAVWARYRMEVTGREPLALILEKRRGADMCGPRGAGEACAVPAAGQQQQQQQHGQQAQ